MVRNYQRKRPNIERYSELDLINAVNDVQNKNKTYREAQETYNVPIAVIYNRIKGRKNPMKPMAAGRHLALPRDVETVIANCLIARARMGWPCDERELCSLVTEYVTSKELKTPFKDNIPGHDWYLGFMKRHPRLSFKKPEHLQKIRKDARDPFVVYDFYSKLQQLITDNSLEDLNKACFVFNADESGFNSDPSRVRAIGEKGKSLSRVSGGSGRESTTVLACISADGTFLPPFILFKGNAVQARWTSENAYPGTLYGASKNGWMEEPHFYQWFVTSFVPHVEALRIKHKLSEQTAILTFDGHCSHASVRIVNAALEHNIELFRFPSHLTDRIQPLDKSVFGPIKSKWDRKLVAHGKSEMGKSSGRLSKSKFVALLSEVWIEGMTSANIISGFKSTGVYPVNSNMFAEEYFDPLQLKKYKDSIASPSIDVQCTASEESRHETSNSLVVECTSAHQDPSQGTSSSVEIHSTPSLQKSNPDGTVNTVIAVQGGKKHSPNSILNLFTQKLQEAGSSPRLEVPTEGFPKKVIPRLRQSTYGEVLTTPEVLKKLTEAEQKKAIKVNKGQKAIKMKENGKKKNKKMNKGKQLLRSHSLSDIEDEGYVLQPNSSDEDLPLSTYAKGIEPKKHQSVTYKEPKWDDIQTDTFILAKFTGVGRNPIEYKYVCVVHHKDEDDGEIAVVGLRSLDKTCSSFFINETIPSYITIDKVQSILPVPETNFEGRKIIYSFPGKVDIFEKP